MRLVGIIRRAEVGYIVGDCLEGRLGLGREIVGSCWIGSCFGLRTGSGSFSQQSGEMAPPFPIARLPLPPHAQFQASQPAAKELPPERKEPRDKRRPVLQLPKPMGTPGSGNEWSETGGLRQKLRPNRSIPPLAISGERQSYLTLPTEREKAVN